MVDDDDMAIELAQIQLISQRIACKVSWRVGHEASGPVAHTDIDPVLLDINMPRIEGFELLDGCAPRNLLDRMSVIMCSPRLMKNISSKRCGDG